MDQHHCTTTQNCCFDSKLVITDSRTLTSKSTGINFYRFIATTKVAKTGLENCEFLELKFARFVIDLLKLSVEATTSSVKQRDQLFAYLLEIKTRTKAKAITTDVRNLFIIVQIFSLLKPSTVDIINTVNAIFVTVQVANYVLFLVHIQLVSHFSSNSFYFVIAIAIVCFEIFPIGPYFDHAISFNIVEHQKVDNNLIDLD